MSHDENKPQEQETKPAEDSVGALQSEQAGEQKSGPEYKAGPALPTSIRAGDIPQPKLFCPNGHILGQVIKVKKGPYHLTRLALWGISPSPDAILPMELAQHLIRGFIDAGSVYCASCGAMREWFPGDDYIERLKATLKARRDVG